MAFMDHTAKEEGDPWAILGSLIDGFNKNRSEYVASSVCKVADESMSAYRPRTTKTGGLPHLAFEPRKPEDLGTEFKNISCSKTGKHASL